MRIIPPKIWGVHFARHDIPGRNGLKRGEQFVSQDKTDIRLMGPGEHDPSVPFSSLSFVETLHFPTRALADKCIAARMDIVRARQLLKESEAEMAAEAS